MLSKIFCASYKPVYSLDYPTFNGIKIYKMNFVQVNVEKTIQSR